MTNYAPTMVRYGWGMGIALAPWFSVVYNFGAYIGVFLQVPSSQKKQRNQTIELSWELYCLVVLFLLFCVICASVPTEGTLYAFH